MPKVHDMLDTPLPAEVAAAPIDKNALALESRSWAQKAAGLKIHDKDSCVQASYLLRSIKGLRAEVQRFFAPHLESAMETKRKAEAARKGLADEQARMEEPLMAAEGVVKRALLAWETEQEQVRQAEERRLQAEAQARAEAVTLAAAAALETEALAAGDADMLEEAHAILDQPIDTPVVSVGTLMPKMQGVSYRSTWKTHPEIDVKALCRAVADGAAPVTFLTPNLTAINQFARATQGAQPIAGLRFFEERQIAARG